MKGLRKRATFRKEERCDQHARVERRKVRQVRSALTSGRILARRVQAVCVCSVACDLCGGDEHLIKKAPQASLDGGLVGSIVITTEVGIGK
jgi:hypothetical protein